MTAMNKEQALDNLWLARVLYDLGGVKFGDYTLGGSTTNSPVFINPKVLVSNPMALRVAAKLMYQEVTLAQSLRRAKALPYDVVAGVPVGGVLLAVAYALESNTPLIYPRTQPQGTGQPGIEGQYSEGTRALLIDDLIAGGSSILDSVHFLNQHGVQVHDAVVLVDRDVDAFTRLKHNGINLISILKVDVMMNMYHASGLIDDEQFERFNAYRKARDERSAQEAAAQGQGDPTPGSDVEDMSEFDDEE